MDKREWLMYDNGDYVCDSCGEVSVNGPLMLCEECLLTCTETEDMS